MAAELGDVYREQVAPVWRYVRARLPSDADAEDVTSEVFTQAARSWGSFDPERGSVGAWLAGIARHAVADWWRGRGREEPRADAAERADVAETTGDDPEGAALRAEGADELRRHLGLLTAREREAVALRFGAGLHSEEVGAALGVSGAAARMLVYRAVGRLRSAIAAEEVMIDDR